MSDAKHDASILGKRTRNINDGPDDEVTVNSPPVNPEEEDDDDDVGPMPMPAEATMNGAAKKKRKGGCIVATYSLY